MRKGINTYLEFLLVALMAIITVDVLWGVFTRYALGQQASWTEEFARFLLIWIGLLGAAWASGKRMHLSINLLEENLKANHRQAISICINALIAVFVLLVLIVGGFRLIYITEVLGQRSPALQVPMSWVYSVIPISGLLIFYFKLDDINRLVRNQTIA